MGRISLVGIESGRFNRRYAYARCRESNKIGAGSSPESLIKGEMGELRYIPVIDRACRFINFCKSF